MFQPLNPIKLMLASGCGFVARVFADVKQVDWILKEAMKHKGFCFIEVLQPCIIFLDDKGYKEKTYNLQDSGHDKTNLSEAMRLADEFDYSGIKPDTRIPLGIFYQKEKPIFEDQFSVLQDLTKKKIGFKEIKR